MALRSTDAANSSEVIEEPTAFDWDDLTATWEVVATTSNK